MREIIRGRTPVRRAGSTWLIACGAALAVVGGNAGAQSNGQVWGSYETPFAATSAWNSRPVGPRFGDFVIPKSDYYPSIAEGAWSTGVFLAGADDAPVTVVGLPNSKGVWDPDAAVYRTVAIPRWPEGVIPASAADGHADIVDPLAGIVHSFYKLRQSEGQWMAAQYAWTRLDGRGWGDPAHYFQGARAAAVPTSGGLMRKHEIDDGRPLYRHALAMSLTYNALSPNPTYVFPATSADRDAATTNTGQIPEGALVMLPPEFDVQTIRTAAVRKVAETLKTYGAYIVDRNRGTPYVIYVENGSGFSLHRGGWNTVAAADLERIRMGLRQVVSVEGWVDGSERPVEPDANLNLLSMRGPWTRQSGTASGSFETWEQAVVFAPAEGTTVMVNSSGRSLHPVAWALPVAGQGYRLRAIATGGARLRLQLRDKASGATLFDSKELNNDEVADFVWPAGTVTPVVSAISGAGGASTVRGELLRTGQ
ncbi:Atrophin-1 multi-domain protein [Aromatoleum toluclasticum]|uniref:Atrophin-1 multi-domain protein n=1 Tax=Aromatoleum toluclasticum TaxID=92003 RepID=UPI001D18245B|nr:Atrophin-1 multi-domain protein [Aromatoleum toluclasticum]MCC4116431.1 Atrophin-1 multi-domain protein [Aromatoleum toluclasticum]